MLFTLLGLTALYLRERKEVENTHSGSEEHEDQSDGLPVSSTDDLKHTQDARWIPPAGTSAPDETPAGTSALGNGKQRALHDINACCNEISIQRSDDGPEDYSKPLPLALQHQVSEDQERDGASDNEPESDSEVPEVLVPANEVPKVPEVLVPADDTLGVLHQVPEVLVPADDTLGVLHQVPSGFSSQLKNLWERHSGDILTLSLIPFFFLATIFLGPMVLMMSGLYVQIKFIKQIITTGYRVCYSYQMPWFRTLSLYFLLCVNFYFNGETIADCFFTLVQMEESVHVFSKYQHFISFALYLVGFFLFVLSLVKKPYRLQFCMFVWTHAILLTVAMHSLLIIEDLSEGTIWIIAPLSFCIDIVAGVLSFFVSHIRLI